MNPYLSWNPTIFVRSPPVTHTYLTLLEEPSSPDKVQGSSLDKRLLVALDFYIEINKSGDALIVLIFYMYKQDV